MNAKRIILAGGSGFIGTALAHEFVRRGYEVIVLTRQPKARPDKIKEVAWDGKTPEKWTQELEGATAVINLTGKNIDCRHTPENLIEINKSRENSVNVIGRAVTKLQKPPRVWVQASAVGYYGDTGDLICTENGSPGDDALSKVCKLWEAAFNDLNLPMTRKVTLRIGFVLGREGGGFPVLAGLTKKFLGGAAWSRGI
jgi:uncharacterized protein (TIGR01777 family)